MPRLPENLPDAAPRARALLIPGLAVLALIGVATFAEGAGASSREPELTIVPAGTSTSAPVERADPEDEATDPAETDDEPEWDVPSRLTAPPIATAKPLAREHDLLAMARSKGDALWVKQADGDRELTLNAELQTRLGEILRSYETPYAAVVAIEPSTGRVLAMAEHSAANPSLRGLTTKAIFPAASIFKVVTAAALLKEGLEPDARECSFGGKRRLSAKMLEDTARDHKCLTLSEALAVSANSVFAKFTHKHLTPEKLRQTAKAFQFNTPLPFPVPLDVSLAAFPEDPFAFASTGAGFGDVFISPLHGALIASVAANKGQWRSPVLFEGMPEEADLEQVLTEEQAAKLTAMMEETITLGTARRIFRQRGFRVPGAVGKTGNLADKRPTFRDYSWFVGFAPKDDPKVAVAAVVVNDMKWRIRATWLGREALRLAIEAEQKKVARRDAAQGKLVTSK